MSCWNHPRYPLGQFTIFHGVSHVSFIFRGLCYDPYIEGLKFLHFSMGFSGPKVGFKKVIRLGARPMDGRFAAGPGKSNLPIEDPVGMAHWWIASSWKA